MRCSLAMIKCSECSKEMSDRAPVCGYLVTYQTRADRPISRPLTRLLQPFLPFRKSIGCDKNVSLIGCLSEMAKCNIALNLSLM